MTKPRGAQPGNQNALKHGFYSKGFQTVEMNDLEMLKEKGGVESEIDMLRVLMRRIMEKAEAVDDLDRLVKIASTLGAISTRISTLTKLQQSLRGGDRNLAEAISQAIDEVAQELNLRERD